MSSALLVVSDDEAIRNALVWILREEGYTVDAASGDNPVLEQLRDHPAGMVVVLDLNQPGADGMAVLDAVEGHSPVATRHTYVLVSALDGTRPIAFTWRNTLPLVPIFARPFGVDLLLASISAANTRLHARSPRLEGADAVPLPGAALARAASPHLERPRAKPGPEAARRGGIAARDKYGPEFYSTIGKKGGRTFRERHGSAFYATIGKKGGLTTRSQQGVEHYLRIGRVGSRQK
jgi:CheY-like chemotaxis protein/general stress protein YciG